MVSLIQSLTSLRRRLSTAFALWPFNSITVTSAETPLPAVGGSSRRQCGQPGCPPECGSRTDGCCRSPLPQQTSWSQRWNPRTTTVEFFNVSTNSTNTSSTQSSQTSVVCSCN